MQNKIFKFPSVLYFELPLLCENTHALTSFTKCNLIVSNARRDKPRKHVRFSNPCGLNISNTLRPRYPAARCRSQLGIGPYFLAGYWGSGQIRHPAGYRGKLDIRPNSISGRFYGFRIWPAGYLGLSVLCNRANHWGSNIVNIANQASVLCSNIAIRVGFMHKYI